MGQNPVSRRTFLIGAAGTSVLFGFPRPGFTAADTASTSPAVLFEPTIWYRIDRSGIVRVSISKAEMGQHIGTALARIVADELEADWDKVQLDYVDTDPKWGLMLTGGSWSVWQTFMPFSQAGAAGRIALIEEAAKLLKVDKETCSARNGAVGAGAHSITYGDIVARGFLTRTFTANQLKAMPIKKPADRRLISHDTKAIDIPAKTNGTARYGIDAEVESMVYARPKIPPTRNGSKVVSIDDSAAKSVKGYIKSIALDDPSDTVPGWVMVFADSFFAADQAADKVKVEWIPGDAVNVSEQDLQDHGAKLIADPSGGSLLVADPGVEAAFAAAKSTLERTYTTSSALHFQLEPVNALAVEKDGVFEIHTGNQWQSLMLPVLAKALAVGEDKVIMRTYLLGGGFGRRLNGDY
jgi:CO/xanthine dehydrogenase Mo-binding subunit